MGCGEPKTPIFADMKVSDDHVEYLLFVNLSNILTVESELPNITPKTTTTIDPLLGMALKVLVLMRLIFGAL